jgi:hypothetical protein
MKRERFWGLYDWGAHDGGTPPEDCWFIGADDKRRRFATIEEATEYLRRMAYDRTAPRPFYVTRKLKLTPTQTTSLKTAARTLAVHGFKRESTELLDEFGIK